MAKKKRDYRAEYRKRQARARGEGFKSYNQKRSVLRKRKSQTPYQQALDESIPSFEIGDKNALKQRTRIANYLRNAGHVDEDSILDLITSPVDQFWKMARPLLERESELARMTT